MPDQRPTDRVTRLLEMVVEEVSLVDRAANKRRFLIVKRSDGMEDTTNDAAPVESDINAPAADSGTPGQDTTPTEEGGDDVGSPSAKSEPTGPLAAAVAALEGLTEAVELLGDQEPDVAGPRLAELAGELQTVAGALAAAVGADVPEQETDVNVDGEGSSPGATEEGQDEPESKGDRLASAVDSIRATLQRVTAALGESNSTDKAQPTAEVQTTGDAAPSPLKEQLGALVTTLQTLTGTVKEQQQRLARLEKRFGLPSSQPVGEQAPKPGASSAGWPLDLNQPVDRESVDKAISFHDL